jgi:hypothetical protein
LTTDLTAASKPSRSDFQVLVSALDEGAGLSVALGDGAGFSPDAGEGAGAGGGAGAGAGAGALDDGALVETSGAMPFSDMPCFMRAVPVLCQSTDTTR